MKTLKWVWVGGKERNGEKLSCKENTEMTLKKTPPQNTDIKSIQFLMKRQSITRLSNKRLPMSELMCTQAQISSHSGRCLCLPMKTTKHVKLPKQILVI